MIKEKNTIANTPYDDVFRTLLNDCRQLIIPIINLAFKEHYVGDENIVFYPNEMFLRQQGGAEDKLITDTFFTIYGYKQQSYHFECESTVDNSILIRMAEYDLQIAMQSRQIKDNVLYLKAPKSAIIYLRHSKDTPDYYQVELSHPDNTQEDGVLRYKIPVVKVQNISIDEIFEKKLYFLIPFYIFSFESGFKEYEEDEGKRSALKEEFLKIRLRLEELVSLGDIDSYTKLTILEMTNKVIRNLTKNKAKISKEVGDTMVGPVLDYEAKRILNKGIAQGKSQLIEQLMEKSLKNGKSPKEISEFLDIPLEDVVSYQETKI